MLRHLLPFLFLTVVVALPVAAQPGTDEQLAAQYFQRGEYDKAILYYEKLYRKTPSPYFYEQLFKSHVQLKQYEEAEKVAKEQLKRGDDPKYFVDLGALYRMMGQNDKSEQQYDKAIKSLNDDANRIRQVANAFQRENEYDRALEAYARGQKLVKDGTDFHFEIATLYGAKGDIEGMVREFMDVLSVNQGYIQAVQNSLARAIDFNKKDQRSDLLRTELLRRIQRDPDKVIFQELLIWMYEQQKDLFSAFVQTKALDKRFNEQGARVMELGTLAVNNKDWEIASKCFDHVRSLGADKPYYTSARIGLIKALDAKVTDQAQPPMEELKLLEQEYTTALSELGRMNGTIELIRGLGKLKAYYLDDRAGAAAVLDQGINIPGLDPKVQAQLKLDLGDVKVLESDIWEASLLYSQVDLDYKHDALGHEARYRNAKVSFYAGDFLWCQAQLDVLKASTSKLIANDAMELSLLITDNLGADSNMVPLSFFARAELLSFQHKYSASLLVLDSLDQEFPMHSIGDEVLMQRARIAMALHEFDSAAVYMQKILDLYPLDILVDNALFELGKLYEERLKDTEKAKAYYEKLLFEQPGSIFVTEARKRYRFLRGDHDGEQTEEEKFLNGTAP
ncbi:MAG: tetratricopeptide repeat protein [Flavobacteriales bacterium]